MHQLLADVTHALAPWCVNTWWPPGMAGQDENPSPGGATARWGSQKIDISEKKHVASGSSTGKVKSEGHKLANPLLTEDECPQLRGFKGTEGLHASSWCYVSLSITVPLKETAWLYPNQKGDTRRQWVKMAKKNDNKLHRTAGWSSLNEKSTHRNEYHFWPSPGCNWILLLCVRPSFCPWKKLVGLH